MKRMTENKKKRRKVYVSQNKKAASKLKSVTMTHLKQFPANCNPFRHDLWRMGFDINERFLAMFEDHDGRSDHVIIIDKPTGRRVRLTFEKEG
jgi:hypothetical protein